MSDENKNPEREIKPQVIPDANLLSQKDVETRLIPQPVLEKDTPEGDKPEGGNNPEGSEGGVETRFVHQPVQRPDIFHLIAQAAMDSSISQFYGRAKRLAYTPVNLLPAPAEEKPYVPKVEEQPAAQPSVPQAVQPAAPSVVPPSEQPKAQKKPRSLAELLGKRKAAEQDQAQKLAKVDKDQDPLGGSMEEIAADVAKLQADSANLQPAHPSPAATPSHVPEVRKENLTAGDTQIDSEAPTAIVRAVTPGAGSGQSLESRVDSGSGSRDGEPTALISPEEMRGRRTTASYRKGPDSSLTAIFEAPDASNSPLPHNSPESSLRVAQNPTEGASAMAHASSGHVSALFKVADYVPHSPSDDSPWTGCQVSGGNYLMLRKLGKGGMGTVYLAKTLKGPGAGNLVAIKFHEISSGHDELYARMRQESEIMARGKCRHFVKYIGSGRTKERNPVKRQEQNNMQDLFYIAMEYVPHTDLEKRTKYGGRMAAGEALKIITDVLEALDDMHRQGLVHRDVKPSNIFVTKDGKAYLADLGLAKWTENAKNTAQTAVGHVMGTPYYMSPEQGKGEATDSRSDVYCAGETLFSFLAGKPPHLKAEHESPIDILFRKIHAADPERLARVIPGIDPHVDGLVACMIELDPAKRYEIPEALFVIHKIEEAAGKSPAEKAEKQKMAKELCSSWERQDYLKDLRIAKSIVNEAADLMFYCEGDARANLMKYALASSQVVKDFAGGINEAEREGLLVRAGAIIKDHAAPPEKKKKRGDFGELYSIVIDNTGFIMRTVAAIGEGINNPKSKCSDILEMLVVVQDENERIGGYISQIGAKSAENKVSPKQLAKLKEDHKVYTETLKAVEEEVYLFVYGSARDRIAVNDYSAAFDWLSIINERITHSIEYTTAADQKAVLDKGVIEGHMLLASLEMFLEGERVRYCGLQPGNEEQAQKDAEERIRQVTDSAEKLIGLYPKYSVPGYAKRIRNLTEMLENAKGLNGAGSGSSPQPPQPNPQ